MVDTTQTNFNLEVVTEFETISPYRPVRNKTQEIRTTIEKKYMESSLYVVEEENIPMSMLPKIEEDPEIKEEERGALEAIDNAYSLKMNIHIENDNLNSHPSMVSLLCLCDFMGHMDPAPIPEWIRPLDTYLDNPHISLA